MKSIKHILLTFDYEPFLGARTGSVKKCLIEPTNHLIKILDIHQAKAVFFVDTLYIQELGKRNELKQDYLSVEAQLIDLYNNGHYIFPHIHPHWIDAIYLQNGQFDLSNLSKYSLAKFNQVDIDNAFTQSITVLKDIGISYNEWGYRAGGWCIQPFHLFEQVFIKNNINYEFSVLPGYKNSSDTQYFDYSDVINYTPYFFSNNESIKDDKGNFLEFPISTIEVKGVFKWADKLIKKYLWKIGDKGFGDLSNEFFITLNYDDYPKREKLEIALDYLKNNSSFSQDYLIRFDDDDVFSQTILSDIEKLPLTYDCYFDEYHTYVDSVYLKLSQIKNFWIANTAIHKYEHATTVCGRANLPLLIQDHSEYWHFYYRDKNIYKAKRSNPIYYRILTPFSITSSKSLEAGSVDWKKHLQYLKGYGPWVSLNHSFRFYLDFKTFSNTYFQMKPIIKSSYWIFNKLKYLKNNLFNS